MVTGQELFLDGLSILAAGLYLTVGWLQAKRPATGESRRALNGFVIWWAGLGGLSIITVILGLSSGLSEMSLNGVRVVFYALFAGIMVMMAGLVQYLAFIYTGKSSTRVIAYAFYALLFLYLIWFIEGHGPYMGIDADTGERGLQFTDEPNPVVGAILSLGLVVPPLFAAVGYFLLFFKAEDRTSKYRIVLVSAGFVLWFAYSTLGTLARLALDVDTQSFGGQLTSQLLGVLAGVLTLLAYHPPRSVQERFRVRPVTAAPEGAAPEPFQRPRQFSAV